MSFALRASITRVCRVSVSAARRPVHTPVIRAAALRRSLQTRAMSAQSDTQLDKNTPDSKWKEVLSAEEVRNLNHRYVERSLFA